MNYLIFAAAAIASTAFGGLFALRHQAKAAALLSLSAGAVLAVALLDLLPEAIELTQGAYEPHALSLALAGGFFGLMLVSQLAGAHSHDRPARRGWVGALSLSLHSLLDGLAVGLALAASPKLGLFVAVAVLTHDFFDGANTVAYVTRHDGSRSSALGWLAADALAPVAGLIAARYLPVSQPVLGLVLAAFCGSFLYLGACDLFPESQHRNPGWKGLALTLAGALLLGFAITVAGH